MTTPNNDQPRPSGTTQPEPVSEAEQLRRLRALMIRRMLEQAADPDIKASGLAVIAKFLSEAGVLAPPAPPTPIPAGKLPFPVETPPAEDQRGRWSGLDQQPFIVS